MPDYDMWNEQPRTDADEETKLDFSSTYLVAHRSGVAWYLVGFSLEQTEDAYELSCDYNHEHDESCYLYSEPELTENKSFVRAYMVGDDHIELIDVSDLLPVDPDDVCSCGQIGCWSPNALKGDDD